MREDLLAKLLRHAISKRELEVLLSSADFVKKAGKGSHSKWIRPGFPVIVIASHDKEVKHYLVRQVIRVFQWGGLL